ncbi:hypothetical protein VP01_338g3, partial [Puccinia sorghi]
RHAKSKHGHGSWWEISLRCASREQKIRSMRSREKKQENKKRNITTMRMEKFGGEDYSERRRKEKEKMKKISFLANKQQEKKENKQRAMRRSSKHDLSWAVRSFDEGIGEGYDNFLRLNPKGFENQWPSVHSLNSRSRQANRGWLLILQSTYLGKNTHTPEPLNRPPLQEQALTSSIENSFRGENNRIEFIVERMNEIIIIQMIEVLKYLLIVDASKLDLSEVKCDPLDYDSRYTNKSNFDHRYKLSTTLQLKKNEMDVNFQFFLFFDVTDLFLIVWLSVSQIYTKGHLASTSAMLHVSTAKSMTYSMANATLQFSIAKATLQFSVAKDTHFSVVKSTLQFSVAKATLQFSVTKATLQFVVAKAMLQFSIAKATINFSIAKAILQFSVALQFSIGKDTTFGVAKATLQFSIAKATLQFSIAKAMLQFQSYATLKLCYSLA